MKEKVMHKPVNQ